jgi:ArsR family transcriptional regulator
MVVNTIAVCIDACQYDPMQKTLDGLCCTTLRTPRLTEDDAAELAGVLKALADPARLRIVSLVASAETGELCACDLPEALDRSQPTVSHHLSLLVSAGILEREQRGKWAWFRLRPQRLAALTSILGTTCC